jgi:hypothetical protein
LEIFPVGAAVSDFFTASEFSEPLLRLRGHGRAGELIFTFSSFKILITYTTTIIRRPIIVLFDCVPHGYEKEGLKGVFTPSSDSLIRKERKGSLRSKGCREGSQGEGECMLK